MHAADIGRLINPMQCRGQIDGAIAMGFGWALYEKMVYDANGAMVNPALRTTAFPRSPTFPTARSISPTPTTPSGRWGPRRKASARSIRSPPAIANAVADATGVRFAELPLSPERIFAQLARRP